jgi:hypothetical protein
MLYSSLEVITARSAGETRETKASADLKLHPRRLDQPNLPDRCVALTDVRWSGLSRQSLTNDIVKYVLRNLRVLRTSSRTHTLAPTHSFGPVFWAARIGLVEIITTFHPIRYSWWSVHK